MRATIQVLMHGQAHPRAYIPSWLVGPPPRLICLLLFCAALRMGGAWAAAAAVPRLACRRAAHRWRRVAALQKVAEREERERRRAEAAKAKEEAKRYPMEDLELLAELRQKAAETGEAALHSARLASSAGGALGSRLRPPGLWHGAQGAGSIHAQRGPLPGGPGARRLGTFAGGGKLAVVELCPWEGGAWKSSKPEEGQLKEQNLFCEPSMLCVCIPDQARSLLPKTWRNPTG